MSHVDALSRRVFFVSYLPVERELKFKQLQDSRIKAIAEELEFKDSDKFQLADGLVYHKSSGRLRFVVPEAMVNNIIRVYHNEIAHCGFEKTFHGIHLTYWFPSMRKRVRDYLDNCITCITANTSTHVKEGELELVHTPTQPFKTIHVDHFGPLQETKEGYKHVLVVIDACTRFTWFFPTKTTSTREICNNLRFLFNVFGVPSEIV